MICFQLCQLSLCFIFILYSVNTLLTNNYRPIALALHCILSKVGKFNCLLTTLTPEIKFWVPQLNENTFQVLMYLSFFFTKKSEMNSFVDERHENSEKKISEVEHQHFSKMDVDELLHHIGEFGRSQFFLLFMLSLLMIPTAYQSLSITFIGMNPSWSCTNKSEECNKIGVFSVNDEFYKQRCSMKRESWRYVKDTDFSIVTEVGNYLTKFYFEI